MRPILVIVAAVLLLSLTGCERELGYAGRNPGAVQCRGKATINITGQGAIGPGPTNQGAGSITFDCGDGAYLEQGAPSITAPINNLPPAPVALH